MKLLISLLLAFASTVAQASVVTYNFSGALDIVDRSGPPGAPAPGLPFLGLVAAGDRVSGHFTFDTAATASQPADEYPWAVYPSLGFHLTGPAIFDLPLAVSGAPTIQVTDYPSSEEWFVDELISVGVWRLDDGHVLQAVLRADTAHTGAFNDYRVPDDFNSFTNANLYLYLTREGEFIRDFGFGAVRVTLDGATAIPEPSTGLLLLAGLGAIAARRRRPQAH